MSQTLLPTPFIRFWSDVNCGLRAAGHVEATHLEAVTAFRAFREPTTERGVAAVIEARDEVALRPKERA
jgi:hypothetical protein